MINAQRARDLLAYDPETGVVAWRVSRGRVKAGTPVQCRNSDGYLVVRIDGRLYLAHRVIWLMQTGSWPDECVDHSNGGRADNVWENFRELSNANNVRNQRKAHRDSGTGLLGACKRGNRYSAQIMTDGVSKHLGHFPSAQAAHDAYVVAKRAAHESCTL